jgi:ribosomal protein L37AE/L43A
MVVKRETISSLLARRLGFRVATGVVYQKPADLGIQCTSCGRRLDVDFEKYTLWWECDVCGAKGPYPAHAIAERKRQMGQKYQYQIGINNKIDARDKRENAVRAKEHGLELAIVWTAILVVMLLMATAVLFIR